MEARVDTLAWAPGSEHTLQLSLDNPTGIRLSEVSVSLLMIESARPAFSAPVKRTTCELRCWHFKGGKKRAVEPLAAALPLVNGCAHESVSLAVPAPLFPSEATSMGSFAREYELVVRSIFPGHYSCQLTFTVQILK